MTDVGVPTPEEEELGRRLAHELDALSNIDLCEEFWRPVGKLAERLGAEALYTDGTRQVFGEELARMLSSRPRKGFTIKMDPPAA